MPSVENFYWILFENLLKPVGLDAWYYYPFGTQNNLSRSEFKPTPPRQEHHVLFHYDQEPIWSANLGHHYDEMQISYYGKIARILANSEHSLQKKQICQQRNFLDWYYFYHGFAALHWFSDSRYITDDAKPKKIYSSFNHLATGLRGYRTSITARLIEKDLMSFGDNSLHASMPDLIAELDDPHCRWSDVDRQIIERNILSRKLCPLILDTRDVTGDFSAHFGCHEYRLWQNSFLHLVNETVFYDAKLHLTEKIFKPIVSLRPFVLAGAPGNLAYLRGYGFKTFNQWWDESYDSISDSDIRSDMIVSIIEKLCSKSPAEIQEMHKEMKTVLQFNKRHFFGDFRRMITSELVDNFDTCLRRWNNGRVDGRELPLHPDVESVKQILIA